MKSLRIPAKFFVTGPVSAATDDGKLLAGHLWTGEHATVIGCFRRPTAYLAGDLGWTQRRTKTALDDLIAVGFIKRDERTGWTLIPSFVGTNPIHNGQAGAGAVAVLAEIPGSLPLCDEVLKILRPFVDRLMPAAHARIAARSPIATTPAAADAAQASENPASEEA